MTAALNEAYERPLRTSVYPGRDIVRLYLDPPDRALVLCVEQKSQIEALDRTSPILPLGGSLPQRQTHDYKRHGTTTLFAAFNILHGKVIGTCPERHRSREFIRFLNHLERQLSEEQEVVQAEAAAPVPLPLHSDQRSWLKQVERLFALITGRMIRRGTFHSADELEQAIYKWLARWNGSPAPFIRKASADFILDKGQETSYTRAAFVFSPERARS